MGRVTYTLGGREGAREGWRGGGRVRLRGTGGREGRRGRGELGRKT